MQRPDVTAPQPQLRRQQSPVQLRTGCSPHRCLGTDLTPGRGHGRRASRLWEPTFCFKVSECRKKKGATPFTI